MLLKCIKPVWQISIILLVMFLTITFTSKAYANKVNELSKETCLVFKDRAYDYMWHRGFGYSKEKSFEKHKRYPSEYRFLNDYDSFVLDSAYKQKLSKDPFEQIDHREAFANMIYQDCLPKVSQYLTQLEQADKKRQQSYVEVEFRCVSGLLSSCSIDNLSVSVPKEVSSTPFEIRHSGRYATIRHLSGGVPAGRYRYSLNLNGKRMCIGEMDIDGKKSHVSVNIYDDCKLSHISSY